MSLADGKQPVAKSNYFGLACLGYTVLTLQFGVSAMVWYIAPFGPNHYIFNLLNNIDRLSVFVGKNRGVWNLKTAGIVTVGLFRFLYFA